MTNLSRRSFLKMLPALPFFKIAWPYLETAVEPRPWQQVEERPNILFLVFDTLSARHVSLHGYDRETTPNLARLADRATVFHNHTATGNFTSPATASMLTGTYPWTHRALHLHGLVRDQMADRNLFNLLPDEYYKIGYSHNLLVMSLLHQFRGDLDQFVPTRDLCLADGQFSDRLFFKDYTPSFWAESTALQGGATPPGTLFLSLLDRANRFRESSDFKSDLAGQYPRGIPNLHSLFFLLEDAVDWIAQQVQALPQPYLGYFHLLPPHEPYTAHADYVNIFAQDGLQPIEKPKLFGAQNMPQPALNRERRLYDEYLAFTDAEIGRLLDQLEADGTFDNTTVILTSDHGELFERGIRGHVTLTLYEPLTHIPLLISRPGQTSREDVFQRTSAVDLLPTLLHLTGQPIPEWVEGTLLPSFSEDSATAVRAIYANEAKSNPKQGPLTKATVSMFKDSYKLVRYFGYTDDEIYELYDLEADPEELTNLYTSQSNIAEDLKQEMLAKIAEVNEPYRV